MSKETRTPKKGPMGPTAPVEKAKNFKSAIHRLLKELKNFRVLIIISLILAMAGAILSILAPNKLSDLTDEISKGLVVNTKNLEEITNKITDSLSEEKMQKVMPEILSINLSKETVNEILRSKELSTSDKQEFQKYISNLKNVKQEEILKLPNSILNIILKDSSYKNVKISSKDKIEFLNSLNLIRDEEN